MRLQVEVRDGARRCALCHGGLEGEASTCPGGRALVATLVVALDRAPSMGGPIF